MGKLLHFLACKAVKNPQVGYTTFYLTTYWYLPVLTTGMKWYDTPTHNSRQDIKVHDTCFNLKKRQTNTINMSMVLSVTK